MPEGHGGIVGITGSGKSRLAKEVLIPGWARRGYGTLVLDPLEQPWPGAVWQTADPWAFLAAAKASEKCVLLIDEASTSLRGDGKLEKASAWLATQSRNRGHKAYFIGQRALQLPPNVRGNCGHFYVFQQNTDDADAIARQFNVPDVLRDAPALPLGVCMIAEPFKPAVKMRVFVPGH